MHPVQERTIEVQTSRGIRLALGAVAAAFVLSAAAGCNYMIMAGYLLGGPPSIDPDFDRETGHCMTDEGVTVAVVCYAPTELRYDYSRIDRDLARYVASRMHLHQIKVVSPDQIAAWLDEHPKWETPAEIGEATGASYVVYLELADYGLYEKNSVKLFRGRAEVLVSVWHMNEDGTGEAIYSRDLSSIYPLHMPRSTYETKYTTFKREFLERLSEEIGRLFYEHYHGDDIPDAA
ncbi:MAG: hypothetical protein KY476_21205 [Planctomycetes bacterium]|nr:hypothetical protein [Planctomycetota bacterium]